jgi:hypothetical protein
VWQSIVFCRSKRVRYCGRAGDDETADLVGVKSMKRKMTFSLAIVVILCAGSLCMGQEKARQKNQGARAKVSAEQKAWQAKLKKMTPEQQKIARAKKAFEASVAPWRKVRQIAAKEKATKTLAAIDQIIAAKQQQFKKRMAGQGRANARPQARQNARPQAGRQARPQAKRQGAAKKQAEKKGARQARPKKKTEGKK